jgi:DNA polymerase sigma
MGECEKTIPAYTDDIRKLKPTAFTDCESRPDFPAFLSGTFLSLPCPKDTDMSLDAIIKAFPEPMKPAGDHVVRQAMDIVEEFILKPVPSDVAALPLKAQLNHYVRASSEPPYERKKKLAAMTHVSKHILDASDGALDVCLYGSAAMDLSTRDSDLDLHVIDAVTREHTAAGVDAMAKLYKRVSKGELKPLLPRGRPLLHMKVAVARMRFKGLEIDLVSSAQSPAKARLVNAYMRAQPRLRPLILAVKGWAKARGLVDAQRGMLNTFSVVLMVIHYLHARHRLPVLQPSSPLAHAHGQYVNDNGLDSAAFRPLVVHRVRGPAPASPALADAIQPPSGPGPAPDRLLVADDVAVGPSPRLAFSLLPPALRDDIIDPDTLPAPRHAPAPALDVLVRGFFDYYATLDFSAYAVSVRSGHLLLADPLRGPDPAHVPFASPTPILIEDPFDPADNTARSLKDGYFASIAGELRRASRLLRAGAAWDAVAEPVEDSVRALGSMVASVAGRGSGDEERGARWGSRKAVDACVRARGLLRWEGDGAKAWRDVNARGALLAVVAAGDGTGEGAEVECPVESLRRQLAATVIE